MQNNSGVNGDYHVANRSTSSYGNQWNRYDTWHPNPLMGPPAAPGPPYRPTDVAGNAIPLRAIQIQIRFYDPGGDTMRDLTFTYSLISQ
jgi:hypothetical protein